METWIIAGKTIWRPLPSEVFTPKNLLEIELIWTFFLLLKMATCLTDTYNCENWISGQPNKLPMQTYLKSQQAKFWFRHSVLWIIHNVYQSSRGIKMFILIFKEFIFCIQMSNSSFMIHTVWLITSASKACIDSNIMKNI